MRGKAITRACAHCLRPPSGTQIDTSPAAVNAKWFGAVGDGTTDNAPVFTAMFKGLLGIPASLTVQSTTGGDGVKFTAVQVGTGGNAISVTYNTPSGATTSVAVSGSSITVSPKSGETNSGVVAAVSSSVAAAILVSAVAVGSGTDAVVARASANLTGGAGPSTATVSLPFGTYHIATSVSVPSGITLRHDEGGHRRRQWRDAHGPGAGHCALIRVALQSFKTRYERRGFPRASRATRTSLSFFPEMRLG